MKAETLLPLGKVDPGLRAPEQPLDIHAVADDAVLVESLGYDGLVVEDTKQDPFVVMALAAQATRRVRLGTAVAIAFPRSPTVTAMTAWTLQKLARGRFTLGLGTQVKGHIERRFGLPWRPPGPWMRDYVRAVRALWRSWQDGTRLDFHSAHYDLTLQVPLFTPEPIEHPDIPIHLAAVNPYLCQVAGEVADGLRPHPVCTAHYLREVMWRARVAFYASTPAYVACFDAHGLGDLARELQALSKAQRWEEMPSRISDEVLDTYAVVGTYDEIVDKLRARYGDLVTHCEFSIPVRGPDDEGRLREMVRALQAP